MRPLLALFFRSIREQTRNKYTPLVRGVVVGIILLFIMGIQDKPWIAAPGRDFFKSLVSINLFFILLAAVSTFSSVITEEKEEFSLGLLRMTNLNPVSILLGKSTSRLCGVLLLMAAQFPFTVLAVTLGGISLTQILAAYAVLISMAFFLCNLALMGSVICKSNRTASLFTIASGFLIYAILPMIYFALTMRVVRSQMSSTAEAWAGFLKYFVDANPFNTLYDKIFSTFFSGPVFGLQFWTHTIGGIVLFLLSVLLFERFCGSSAEADGQTAKKAKAGSKSRRPRAWTTAAIAWKDFNFFYGGKKGLLIRALVYIILIGLSIWFGNWSSSPYSRFTAKEFGEVLLMWSIILACIEILSVSAGMLGRERKLQTMSSLVTLPINTGQIIRYKLLGALPLFILPLVLLLVSMIFNPRPVQSFFRGIASIDRFEEFLFFMYASLQFLIFPILVVNLSLRFRYLAIPIAVGIVFACNFGTGIFMMLFRGESEAVIIPIIGLIVGLVVLIKQIYALIPRIAAEN